MASKIAYYIIGTLMIISSIYLFLVLGLSLGEPSSLFLFEYISGVVILFALGILYFYYGRKKEKINSFSNFSLWLSLILFLIIGIIFLIIFSLKGSYGEIQTVLDNISRILKAGFIISLISSIWGLFK